MISRSHHITTFYIRYSKLDLENHSDFVMYANNIYHKIYNDYLLYYMFVNNTCICLERTKSLTLSFL